jgi:hypothetical protein
MGRERKISGTMGRMALILLFALSSYVFFPKIAHAQSVVLPNPFGMGPNSTFRIRNGKPHRGNDYPTPCGTQVSLKAPVRCDMNNPTGYGRRGTVSHACEVTEQFSHLSSCMTGQSTIKTGGAKGAEGAGNSTGCHVHYEIRIAGTAVDPMEAYGKDLCNGEVRKQLIEDAQKKLNGKAGGGGASTGGASSDTPPNSTTPAPPPPTADGSGFESVEGGTASNPGPGYTLEYTIDGRTIKHIDLGGQPGDTVTLPPTTENVVPTTGASGDGQVTGCATDTWTAMVNQAVLQTRREMLFNQRYIAKGDSVMAYSCMAEQLTLVGEQIGPIFNETQLWVNKEIDILNGAKVTVNVDMGRSALDGAVVNLATEPYEAFLKSVYNHDFLGGMAPGLTGGDSTQDHAPCGVMAKVWQVAKCMNLTDDPPFPKFEELIGNDPRKYPSSYLCNDTGITQNMINIARNGQVQKTVYETHLNMIYPTGGCHAAIPTGITVERQEGATQITTKRTYADGLCISVGCSYQGTSCVVQGR